MSQAIQEVVGFRSASEPMPFEAQYDIRNPINAYAMAAARYMSSFPVMSLVRDEVTMITSSAMVERLLMPR